MDSSIDLIRRLIAEGEQFSFSSALHPDQKGGRQYGGPDTPAWLAWKTRSINLVRTLTEDTSPATRLTAQALDITTEGHYPEKFEELKTTLIKALQICLEAVDHDAYGELRQATSSSESGAISNKVFVVHGHDTELKNDVERFIHEVGLVPIVLHRQPDQGKTLIEKFEHYCDVGYAFVLLTPDDIGYPRTQEDIPDEKRSHEYRARQNVIFEFGFFVGRLGRNRVCCLYKEGVVPPSDLSGLVYKKIERSLDSQAYSIIKELKAAGYDIRM